MGKYLNSGTIPTYYDVIKMKDCPTCEGDGEIQGEVDYDNNDIPIWNLEKCPRCNGTGRIENEEK